MQLTSTEKPQVRGRHAYHLIRRIVEEDLSADNVWRGRKTSTPNRIAENDYVRPSTLLFGPREPATELRHNSERIEETGADPQRPERLRLPVPVVIVAVSVWWAVSAKNWFTGPRHNIDEPAPTSSTEG